VLPELFEAPPGAAPGAGRREERKARELAQLRATIEACGGNVAEAARRLGIGRSTVYRKLGGA
jgi:propionate catabolism operon transcriptional regulator